MRPADLGFRQFGLGAQLAHDHITGPVQAERLDVEPPNAAVPPEPRKLTLRVASGASLNELYCLLRVV